ncbi:MAG: iron dependent repressor, metal binding and dimerization domain protein [Anaerolineales bacterium]|nr:iron dependent repressor, metal binding and dimerization domain protein [Anaerolineales bacterium]
MEWVTFVEVLLVVFTLSVIFFSGRGVIVQMRRWRATSERQRIEDALKLLLDYQWQQRPISARMLAADLRLSDTAGLRLVNIMQRQGLLETRGSDLQLTSEGQRAALQMMRAHRLLERYLATEARMPLTKVHREAHRLEHTLSPAEVDRLEADLGYPRRDPHGDPIPGPAGEMPSVQASALTAWELNKPAKIVHLEDEPPLAYAQILAEGLRLGQEIRILEITPQRYVLTDGDNEYRLAPAVAANVFVEALPEPSAAANGVVPLKALAHRQKAEIVALDDACQGFTRRRFLDLGLTPGTVIFPELLNSFGDPRAYRVRGTLIALRDEQASQIWVRPLNAQ